MYKDLSLKEKAKVIREGVRLGLNSIDDILSLYDEAISYLQEKPIISPYGQWKYPGRDTIIPSNNITMANVNYPVLGVSDTGDTKVMMPWNNYKFRGSMVYEHPLIGNLALEGKKFNRQRISDDDYFSIMEKVALENNAKWNKDRKKRNQRLLSIDEELVRLLNSNDYDYRGYYTKYPNSKANADTHWTDEFKTVYHPTFSEESRYSGVIDRNYNPYGYIGGSWGNNDEFIPAPWLAGNQYLLGGEYNKYSIFDKWREYNTKKQDYYNQLPIVNEQAGIGRIDLPEVTIEGEDLLQKDYDNLRQTLKSNPFVLASAVQDPFMSTVLANKNRNDQMEAALNLENIYDKMLQATMLSSFGKNILLGSIPEKVSTIGSLFGAYGADKVQSKIIQEASDNKYSSWENMLQGFGIPNSIGMFINPAYWIGGKYGGKYANHVGRNATEAVVRLGDLANAPAEGAKILLKDPNTYKFVFGNKPDLAYKVGTGYSGEAAVTRDIYYNPEYLSLAHKGDLIDVYFGKSKSKFPQVGRDRVSKELNNYIDENYAGREVPVYDMGEVVSPYKIYNTMDLYKYASDMSSAYQNIPSVMRYNKDLFGYEDLLDPGNFHVANRSLTPTKYVLYNEDLFKWNPKDYFNPRSESKPKNLLTRGVTNLGLKAINEYGNPFVSLWNDVVKVSLPSEFKKGGSIHIKPENRGKFTALKKRTGHSASWFKAHGTPALKKMATFALNSRHWNKHALGGYLEGEVYDLPEEEIMELINAGYEIEYL